MQFKQTDTRNLRSKSILNEIETLYDERHEQEEVLNNNVNGERQNIVPEGPHMTIEYQDPAILDDANNLLIHHVKRQTSIHKEDKQKIKLLLRHFLMDTFKHPRQDLSEDEREDEDDSSNKEDNESDTGNTVTGNGGGTTATNNGNGNNANSATANNSTANNGTPGNKDNNNTSKATRSERARKKKEEKREKDKQLEEKTKKEKNEKAGKDEITEADIKVERKDGRRTPLHARDMEADESYLHIMCNNNWYLFFRLHHILCERLTKMYNQAVIIASDEAKDKKDRKEGTAVALRLKPTNEIEPEDYYPAFLDMVKNLLDGNAG
jgi:paired amphipathic helix protein Sin3a